MNRRPCPLPSLAVTLAFPAPATCAEVLGSSFQSKGNAAEPAEGTKSVEKKTAGAR